MSNQYKIRNQDALYFITSTVVKWVDIFTRIEYKDVLVDSLKHCQKEKGLDVYAWCIMTNHIHLIIGRSGTNKIGNIVRDFKKYTSVKLIRDIISNESESRKDWMLAIFREEALKDNKHLKYQIWRENYHPIELASNEMMDQKLEYIHFNPVKAGIVSEPEAYIYSSALDYRTKLKGLIDIKFIE